MLRTQQKINLLIVAALFVCLFIPTPAKANDYALDFDGIDDYVEVPHSDELGPTEAITIEAWFKVGAFSVAVPTIIEKGEWQAPYPPYWYLYVYNESPYPDSVWFDYYDGSQVMYIGGNNLITYNQWQQVVVTGEGTNWKMFVNGNEVDQTTTGLSLVSVSNPIYVGSGDPAFSGAQDYYFDGSIDEVRIYSRAISTTEVSEHYQGIFNNETDLVGLWHFDEGQESIVYDSSDQQNNGTISDALWITGKNYVGPPLPPPVEPPGPPSHRPQIEIESPRTGSQFSEIIEIKYKATDKNDVIGSPLLGLGNDAVSLFYSDDGGESWILIAEKLPPIGSYQWDVSDLSEGDFYQLRALVEDKIGEKTQQFLDSLIIDRTPPLFDVSVEPSFSRGENVTINIQATKPLLEAPKVSVRQRNYYKDIKVTVSGEGKTWEGIYEVISGIDGTAKISVEGKDLAGNIGTIIRKGGFFHIGIKPPPQPIITSPFDNDIVDTPFISVVGNVREDTKAVLILNDKKIQEAIPDREGNFVIEDIELSKTFNKGINILKIISEDKGGNLSDPITLSIKFNILPTLKILQPKGEDILFSTTTIKISAKDENADNLTFSIEANADNGDTWQELVNNLKKQIFIWDTREFPDGKYILRVKATDGFEEVEVISEKFLLRNFLPVISFEKERIITNKDSFDITGLAELRLESYRGPKKNITDVEYSLDQGENWLPAQAKDESFDTISEEFVISLSNLEEGLYEILVKATDARNLVGKAKVTLITDFGPPPEPTVNSPKIREVFGDKEDLDINKAGVQIALKGLAEPDNQIIVHNGPLRFEGLSDSEGNFNMEVTLREHGENILKISAIDPAGNRSEAETTLILTKNNPPNLKFLWPRSDGGLNHIAEIIFEIQDRDLDSIKESSLSYRRVGDKSKILLARNLIGNTFSFDVNNFQQGFYELILEATDGVSENSIIRKFIIDNTSPQISFEPLEKTAFTQSFTLLMTGTAQDDFSGIEYIEYSIDSENWFKALITSGYKEKEAHFRVKHPFELEDGTYKVTFRATDVSGNVSKESESQEIIVDTTPPRIGSYTLSVGTIILLPEDDSFEVVDGTKIKFTISLEKDTKEASLFIYNQEITLEKKIGLWEKEISLSGIGEHEILILAEDSLGNKTEKKEIGTIELINKGKVLSLENNPIEKVKITISIFNKENQSWVRWQAEAYDLMNPVFTDKNGEYEFLLPPGRYQILLQKTGFKRLKSSGFNLLNPRFVSFDFKLEPRTGLRGFFEDLLEKITF